MLTIGAIQLNSQLNALLVQRGALLAQLVARRFGLQRARIELGVLDKRLRALRFEFGDALLLDSRATSDVGAHATCVLELAARVVALALHSGKRRAARRQLLGERAAAQRQFGVALAQRFERARLAQTQRFEFGAQRCQLVVAARTRCSVGRALRHERTQHANDVVQNASLIELEVRRRFVVAAANVAFVAVVFRQAMLKVREPVGRRLPRARLANDGARCQRASHTLQLTQRERLIAITQ